MKDGLHNLRINEDMLLKVASSTVAYDAYAKMRLEALKQAAISIYNRKKVGGNRKSPTSPPRYLDSWEAKKVGRSWWLINFDPGALWVEFGAHAGGKTLVLKYRPLGGAIDSVGTEVG